MPLTRSKGKKFKKGKILKNDFKINFKIPNNGLIRGTRGKPQTFPYILKKILEEEKFKKYIKWTSDGTGIILSDEKSFQFNVLLKIKNLSNNFSSFQRQLNLYCFKKDKNNIYSNENFKRNFINFKELVRMPLKKTSDKSKVLSENNFKKIAEISKYSPNNIYDDYKLLQDLDFDKIFEL